VNYLLDTNVVSEWTKPRPNAGVVGWLAEMDEDRLFISVVTLGELQYGMERLAPGAKRKQLLEWLGGELRVRFEKRVLEIDDEIAVTWGKMLASTDAAGRPVGSLDGYIAATALVKSMTVVTRNEADFAASGLGTLNPWSE
jgi:predicted nucleic acid-binding protein